MTSADIRGYHDIERDGNRVLGFYALLLANLGSFGILFFWVMGAVLLLTGNGGQLNLLGLEGVPLLLFWAFPVVVLVSLAGWLLYLLRLDLLALAVAGAPVALAALYYLWVVFSYGY